MKDAINIDPLIVYIDGQIVTAAHNRATKIIKTGVKICNI